MGWNGKVELWALAGLVACGPTVGNPPEAGSGGSTSENGTSGSTDASASSVSATTESSDESSGAPLTCEDFHDEDGTQVMIEVRNVGTAPVLLEWPCWEGSFSLATASGLTWPGAFCSPTCEQVFTYGCQDETCDQCPSASYTVVTPGASETFSWSGTLYADVSPPAECFAMGSCGDTCPQRRVPTEAVTVTVSAITHAACVAAEPDPAVCDCDDPTAMLCETHATVFIEPSLFGMAIYDPAVGGTIHIDLAG